MAVTYEAISTQTLGTSAATVTFTSISQDYTDLLFVGSLQTLSSGAYLRGTYNGDAGNNYSQTTLYGNGTSASSSRNTNSPVNYFAQIGNTSSTSFTIYSINFTNYSNTTTHKTILTRCGHADFEMEAVVGLWRSTAAINAITFSLNFSSFAVGSTFSLYGIKASA